VTRAIEVRGLDVLHRRFAALGAMTGLEPALRAEAEAVAEAARERLRERDPTNPLAQSVEVTAQAGVEHPAFAVGTPAPAGSYLEFGTSRRLAEPWLVPVLHAHLPGINHAVRKLITAALKAFAKM
jgi:hypothetical protein